jgi:hypothetical protein
MDPEDVLAGSEVVVSAAKYDVVRAQAPIPDAFATIDDGRETTVVVEADAYDPTAAEAVEPGWRALTFDLELPFDLVGFLAHVATALAAADVTIFALSAYSTDHVLVPETDLAAALERLADLGCRVRRP